MITLPKLGDYRIQSPFLYLQAAGSDNSDGTAQGAHLRWQFLRSLGEKHFAKGNLASNQSENPEYYSTDGFNKTDDYVEIYRRSYDPSWYEQRIEIQLTEGPTEVISSNDDRFWKYNNLSNYNSTQTNGVLKFLDIAQYDILATTYDPVTEFDQILNNYVGPLEIYIEDNANNQPRIFFSAEIQVNPNDPTNLGTNGDFKIETVRISDTLEPITAINKTISHRGRYTGDSLATQATPNVINYFGENMLSIRFSYFNYIPTNIILETYEDALKSTDWDLIGSYSLSLDDSVVLDEQLRNSAGSNNIDSLWPKYMFPNQPHPTAACINTDNYEERWNSGISSLDNLKEGVIQYLTLSVNQNNLEANEMVSSDDGSQMEVSFFNMLNLVALDFHVARMLGMGCIDNQPVSGDVFIYAARYVTYGNLDVDTQVSPLEHFSMSLPTSIEDYRLPPDVELEDISYGVKIDDGTGKLKSISDEYGYSFMGDMRYICINKAPLLFEDSFSYFFSSFRLFSSLDKSRPVLYDINYMLEGSVSLPPTLVRDKISDDLDFQDHADFNEKIPLLDQPNPIFIHDTNEPGFHGYALCAINWFSRMSEPQMCYANQTVFEPKHFLIPPLNVAVQLIQPESTPILTTTAEQSLLADITDDDKTLVRLTFDWNNIHNSNYQFADKVEFFFKSEVPLVVKGRVTNITELNDEDISVETESYFLESVSPQIEIIPIINSNIRFLGSTMAVNDLQFEILSINNSNANSPVFTLKKIRQPKVTNPGPNGPYYPTFEYVIPEAGSLFTIHENLNNPDNWDGMLNRKLTLFNFNEYNGQTLHTEDIVLASSENETAIIGGIFQQGTITEQLDAQSNRTGIYQIVFSSYSIPSHDTDPSVRFDKGSVRITSDGTSDYKTLQVLKIDNNDPPDNYSPLTLWVYDPDYLNAPIIPNDMQPLTKDVNFHPSYKIYLYTEGPTDIFKQSNILPTLGTGSKMTYIGARSIHQSFGYTSSISPSILIHSCSFLKCHSAYKNLNSLCNPLFSKIYFVGGRRNSLPD